MGYQFQGIFLAGSDALALEIRTAWPGARSRRTIEPFPGWAIALPTSEWNDEGTYNVPGEDSRLRVMHWSRRVPKRTVVFIEADCFGGTCLYAGCVYQDGRLLHEERFAPRGTGVLKRLVAALDVHLSENEDFPPLTRGYFER